MFKITIGFYPQNKEQYILVLDSYQNMSKLINFYSVSWQGKDMLMMAMEANKRILI